MIYKKKKHLTDSDLKKIAKSIIKHTYSINNLCEMIRDSDHPKAQKIWEDFWEQALVICTDARDIVNRRLGEDDDN